MFVRYGIWNFRSPCREWELIRCKLDLILVEVVRWDKDGVVFEDDLISSCRKGNETHPLRSVFAFHWGIMSAAKRAEFINDTMSCICLDIADVLAYCSEFAYPKLS
jgi:hypothetical protein